jgi:hypothetical protein
MESMHGSHQYGTRDWDMTDLDVSGTEETACHGREDLEEVGTARAKTIRTKGLFNFMELPTEIRVKVCGLTEEEPSLCLSHSALAVRSTMTVHFAAIDIFFRFLRLLIYDADKDQIYNLLLISPEVIDIGSDKPESLTTSSLKLPYPPAAILQTCKKVDEEATPILYGKNAFAICLRKCRPDGPHHPSLTVS